MEVSSDKSVVYVFPVCLAPCTTKHFLSFESFHFFIKAVAFLLKQKHLLKHNIQRKISSYQHFGRSKRMLYQHFG